MQHSIPKKNDYHERKNYNVGKGYETSKYNGRIQNDQIGLVDPVYQNDEMKRRIKTSKIKTSQMKLKKRLDEKTGLRSREHLNWFKKNAYKTEHNRTKVLGRKQGNKRTQKDNVLRSLQESRPYRDPLSTKVNEDQTKNTNTHKGGEIDYRLMKL